MCLLAAMGIVWPVAFPVRPVALRQPFRQFGAAPRIQVLRPLIPWVSRPLR